MANLRRAKKELKEKLSGDNWQEYLDDIAKGGKANVGALFSFLLLEPTLMHRAARALGMTVARIYETEPDAAKNIIRDFMWHMNEDSGNIGWGIPDAFAETLAASPGLAAMYSRILDSYIYDLGFADNYCDHDELRRECYWAVGRLAQTRPEYAEQARPWLLRGLEDQDSLCRGMAAWALGNLPPSSADKSALAKLVEAGNSDICEIFDNNQLNSEEVSKIAEKVLHKLYGGKEPA